MRWISGSNFVMSIISFKFLIEDSGIFKNSFNKFYGFWKFNNFFIFKAMFLNLHLTKKISKISCCYNVKIHQKEREVNTTKTSNVCSMNWVKWLGFVIQSVNK
jgi:hypothetical protein